MPDRIPPQPPGAVPHVLRFGTPSRLRTAVAKSGWPSYQVAAMAGIAPLTMSHYLNRKKKILPHHLRSLSDLLQVAEEDLVDAPLPQDER